MNYNIKQKGSAIVFTILILAVIMTITLTLIRILVPKIRAVNESVKSVVAIYAADSATEVCLFESRRRTTIPRTTPLLTNGALFTITSISHVNGSPVVVNITSNCMPLGPATFSFQAIGEYQGVTRALQISQ